MRTDFCLVLLLSLVVDAPAAPEPLKTDGQTLVLLHLNESSGTAVANDAPHSSFGAWTVEGALARGAASVAPSFGTAYGPFVEGGVSSLCEGRQVAAEVCGDRADYTVEAWVKWAGEGALRRPQVLAGCHLVAGEASLGYGWTLALTPILKTPSVEIVFSYIGGGKGAVAKTPEIEWDEDAWYHVATTVSVLPDNPKSSVFRFYVTPAAQVEKGAQLVATVTNHSVYIPAKAAPGVSGAFFFLGGTNRSGGRMAPLRGLVDEFRISEVARTSFFGVPSK